MEIWKAIPEYPGYEASDHGRIGSCKKRIEGGWAITKDRQRVLKQHATIDGYLFVPVSCEGVRGVCRVAHLVLLAFVGKRPPMMEICHFDGDKKNNNLSNLRYDTKRANGADRRRHHRERGRGLFDKDQIVYIRTCIANKVSTISKIADEFDVTKLTIRKICLGKTYSKYPGPITSKLPREHRSKIGKNKYRGVTKPMGSEKYCARIWEGGRGGHPVHLGTFDTEKDAARAYDKKAKEMHGAFAFLNFPNTA